MKTLPLRARRAALPLAVLAGTVASAHAQSAHVRTLSTTVVSATRFSEDLQALPLGVSVLTSDDIRRSGASTVNEAVMRLLGVPGRQDLYGGGDYTLDLRGFGSTADSNQVVVLDGVRLNEADLGGTRLAGIPIDGVERIEVLRGSGAVLYGEGATGGVIVITTKAGQGMERRSRASLQAGAGSNGLRDLRGSATLVHGGFSLDLNAQQRTADNHRENFRSESDGGGVTAQWSNDATRLGVRYGRDALDTGLPGSLTAAQYASNPYQAAPGSRTNRASIRNERAGLFAETLVGDWQLAADVGWRDKSLASVSPTFIYAYTVDARQIGLRARHASRWAGASNVLVMGHDRGDWSRDVAGTSGSQADQTSKGWYLKDDLTLAGGTRLSAGVRTESIDKRLSRTAGPVQLADRENAWELGLSQPLSGSTTAWARMGNSFRLANVDEFSFTNPNVAIRPQTSRDLESGLRWTTASARAELRLYRSNLTDEIGYDPNAIGPNSAFGFNGANINLDPTRRTGVEAETDWTLQPGLTVGLRWAYRRSTFRSGPNAGRDVPLAPRQVLAVRASWSPAENHRVSGGLNRVGTQSPDSSGTCRMPAYTTADARYAYQSGSVEWSLSVANLFDRNYYTQAFRCVGGQPSAIYPEAGRQFVAAVRVAF